MIFAMVKLFLFFLALAFIGERLKKLSDDRGNRQTREYEEECEKRGIYHTKY